MTEFKTEVRRARRSSWKDICSDIYGYQARLRRVLAKYLSLQLTLLRDQKVSILSARFETLKVLLGTHFPGCVEVDLYRAETPGNVGALGVEGAIRPWLAELSHTTGSALGRLDNYSHQGDKIRPACL